MIVRGTHSRSSFTNHLVDACLMPHSVHRSEKFHTWNYFASSVLTRFTGESVPEMRRLYCSRHFDTLYFLRMKHIAEYLKNVSFIYRMYSLLPINRIFFGSQTLSKTWSSSLSERLFDGFGHWHPASLNNRGFFELSKGNRQNNSLLLVHLQ